MGEIVVLIKRHPRNSNSPTCRACLCDGAIAGHLDSGNCADPLGWQLIGMASNLLAMASNQIAMASSLRALAFTVRSSNGNYIRILYVLDHGSNV